MSGGLDDDLVARPRVRPQRNLQGYLAHKTQGFLAHKKQGYLAHKKDAVVGHVHRLRPIPCHSLYLTQCIYQLISEENQFPHKTVNSIFQVVIVKTKLTILWES